MWSLQAVVSTTGSFIFSFINGVAENTLWHAKDSSIKCISTSFPCLPTLACICFDWENKILCTKGNGITCLITYCSLQLVHNMKILLADYTSFHTLFCSLYLVLFNLFTLWCSFIDMFTYFTLFMFDRFLFYFTSCTYYNSHFNDVSFLTNSFTYLYFSFEHIYTAFVFIF